MCQKIQKARGNRSELDVMSWRDENYPERIKKLLTLLWDSDILMKLSLKTICLEVSEKIV